MLEFRFPDPLPGGVQLGFILSWGPLLLKVVTNEGVACLSEFTFWPVQEISFSLFFPKWLEVA